MASDGCPESQVVLAKQLLEEQCGKYTFNLFKFCICLISQFIFHIIALLDVLNGAVLTLTLSQKDYTQTDVYLYKNQ